MKNKKNNQKFIVIGINCNGLSGKRNSFTANLEQLKPSVFFIQETKFMRKGLFKATYFGSCDEIEILVVEGTIQERKCRFINGYGPQESADINKRIQFYARLEEEIIKAKLQNTMICLEFDANAKLGPEIIANDPHDLTPNGELLLGIIVRNSLVVCNGTRLCEGLLTRTRKTVNGLEESVIDFLIVCEELFNHMEDMKVDEQKLFAVESYTKTGKNVKVTQTDHNMLIGTFNAMISDKYLEQRKEIFKYNDIDGQKRFKDLTSKNILSKCFDEENDVVKASSKWLKELKNILHRSFKKVRVCKRGKTRSVVIEKIKIKQKVVNDIETLKNDLKSVNNGDKTESIKKIHVLEDKLETIGNEIAEINALKHANAIQEHFEELTNDDGQFSSMQMWRLKKKLFKNQSEVPTAMVDPVGNLISGKYSLRELYKTTYQDRLGYKSIKPGWEGVEVMKNYLFEKRIEHSSSIKSRNWNLEEVKKVCKKLKHGKARDRDDLIFELFKPDYAGNDLMISMMKMFNMIKENLKIPKFLQKVTITSLYKNKGAKNDFANQRGVWSLK